MLPIRLHCDELPSRSRRSGVSVQHDHLKQKATPVTSICCLRIWHSRQVFSPDLALEGLIRQAALWAATGYWFAYGLRMLLKRKVTCKKSVNAGDIQASLGMISNRSGASSMPTSSPVFTDVAFMRLLPVKRVVQYAPCLPKLPAGDLCE